jgi:DNA-binding NtrC family response regulator
MIEMTLPRILVIDDLYGRSLPDRRNRERANLCGQYLIEDITGDEVGKGTPQKIRTPIAQAYFYRGQKPACARVGDFVENDLEGAMSIVRDGCGGWTQAIPGWTMVLLDLCFYTGRVSERSHERTAGMPEGNDEDADPTRYFGLQILKAIQEEFPDLPVVILSSMPREEVSREFSKLGARAFLPRDQGNPQILQEYFFRYGLIPDNAGNIIGHSKALLLALRQARQSAATRRNILIRGETGTGKELIARYIHSNSGIYADSPFELINSAALSSTLWTAELFGVRKRAATGVDESKGKIRAANGGDLFFDEIGDMLPDTQAGILRILEERVVYPVGAETKSYPVDVRFLSATNVDIEGRVGISQFRSDLLYRLREGGNIFLPPLRERREDLPLLVERCAREAEAANPIALRRDIDPEAIQKILAYDWPGNIRELRTCIFKAVNDHPEVEYLVDVHVQIPKEKVTSTVTVYGSRTEAKKNGKPDGDVWLIDELVERMNALAFETLSTNDLVGKMPELDAAFVKLMARYLKVMLEATRQATPNKPEGEISITVAVKLMLGVNSVLTSKAADIIKQILNSESIRPMLEDPVLKDAYNTALRLRPKGKRSSNQPA